MTIKEFNFLLKSSQNIDVLQPTLLAKINSKCDSSTGYISKIYDVTNNRIFILVSDNLKALYSLDKNIYELGSATIDKDNSGIDVIIFN